jgi:phosphatidylglycerophosphatase A
MNGSMNRAAPAGGHDVEDAVEVGAPRRASGRFMLGHPARWIALGFGSGLSPWAPGTVGTLWGWASFLLLDRWLGDLGWALAIVAALLVGWWACTRTAQHLGTADPGAIVWDEIVAFWIVLWLVTPAGFWDQCAAFLLFRAFDAGKPGPVGWADRRFERRIVAGQAEPIGARHGFGILFDDLVAALCTLLVVAAWSRLWTP